ncbi:MAG: dTDP-glucose 4,6-dehydratase [Flavobacteriaceae bacterium]
MKNKTILITGGLGFIGGHFVQRYRQDYPDIKMVVVDKNTYAAEINRITPFLQDENFIYLEDDVANSSKMHAVFQDHQPDVVLHFAAESHVDNSIAGPEAFLTTNVKGTFTLLEAARRLWLDAPHQLKPAFEQARFYHISTDEVFGSLGEKGAFNEQSNYAPNSPYSASKAAADHWVRSYYHTYGLPTLLSQCSNNYGPYQHSEKLIPTVIRTALQGRPIPLYGDGKNRRDWLYVEDHCDAILTVLQQAEPGESYTIGGGEERDNLSLCKNILSLLDQLQPKKDKSSYLQQISFVQDRPGHDFRYAIDASKIKTTLGWAPQHSFETALQKTVVYYLKKFNQV